MVSDWPVFTCRCCCYSYVAYCLLSADHLYYFPAAKLLRELAEDFIEAFIVVAGPGQATVYMHWMLCHVEQVVREYGSLKKFCCQALEALHGLLKRYTHTLSNRSAKHTCGTTLTRVNLLITNTTKTSNSRGMVQGAVSKNEAVVVNPGHLSKAQLELKAERGEKFEERLLEWQPKSKRQCCAVGE